MMAVASCRIVVVLLGVSPLLLLAAPTIENRANIQDLLVKPPCPSKDRFGVNQTPFDVVPGVVIGQPGADDDDDDDDNNGGAQVMVIREVPEVQPILEPLVQPIEGTLGQLQGQLGPLWDPNQQPSQGTGSVDSLCNALKNIFGWIRYACGRIFDFIF